MMDLEEEVIPRADSTPSFITQASAHGWKASLFEFGGPASQNGMEYFNPGLVRRPDGLWLLVRASELQAGKPYGHNRIWACRLSEDLVPEGGPLLLFPDSGSEEQFEDPRAVYWNNQTWVGCANFTWFDDMSWTGAHQVLGIFTNGGMQGNEDKRWDPLARRDPPVETNLDKAGETNGRHNKNWLWFFHDGKLHLIYLSDPWHVVEFGSSWDEQIHHKWEGVKWKFGTVRGGTPPVLGPDGRYYTFFHSSVPWRGRYRRYHMGALCFEATPPFKPLLWTSQPLLSGSQNDPWGQKKPLVVFPCGSILENDWWTVTMGINDLRSGWVKIPHEDVLKLMQPAPEMPGLALLASKTERQQHKHIPFDLSGSTDGRAERQYDGDSPSRPDATGSAASIRDLDHANVTEGKAQHSATPNRGSENQSSPAQNNSPAYGSDRIYKPELLAAPPSWQTTGPVQQPPTAPVVQQSETAQRVDEAELRALREKVAELEAQPVRTPAEQAAINERMAKMRAARGLGQTKKKTKRKKKR